MLPEAWSLSLLANQNETDRLEGKGKSSFNLLIDEAEAYLQSQELPSYSVRCSVVFKKVVKDVGLLGQVLKPVAGLITAFL